MSGQADEKTREYIKRKINSAQWLIEAIEQRRGTLTKVAQAIVDHQVEFLNRGPEFLEPLKMQQIADKVGVHVTTVSAPWTTNGRKHRAGFFRSSDFLSVARSAPTAKKSPGIRSA